MKFKKTGNWYVDPKYGNDTDVLGSGIYNATTNPNGHGSPFQPFATANKAAISANTYGGKKIVLGSGKYSEVITAGSQLEFYGDGYVLFSGEMLTAGATCMTLANVARVEGVRFYKFQGTRSAIGGYMGGGQLNPALYKCVFSYCNFNLSVNNYAAPSDPFFNAEYCVFEDVAFIAQGAIARFGFLKNCVLNNCQFSPVTLSTQTSDLVINNYFKDCNLMTSLFSDSRPVNAEFDYNIFEGNFGGKTYAQIQTAAPWINLNGYSGGSYTSSNIFNNLPTYSDITVWANDYSHKSTSPAKDKGKNGIFIGARGVGYPFNATYLYSNAATVSNLNYDFLKGTLALTSGTTPLTGELITNEIDLGSSVKLGDLPVFQNIIYNTNGTAKQYIDTATDAAPSALANQKTSYSIEISYGNTSGSLSGFKKFEIGIAASLDESGNGNGEEAYSPAVISQISARYIKIRLVFVRE